MNPLKNYQSGSYLYDADTHSFRFGVKCWIKYSFPVASEKDCRALLESAFPESTYINLYGLTDQKVFLPPFYKKDPISIGSYTALDAVIAYLIRGDRDLVDLAYRDPGSLFSSMLHHSDYTEENVIFLLSLLIFLFGGKETTILI